MNKTLMSAWLAIQLMLLALVPAGAYSRCTGEGMIRIRSEEPMKKLFDLPKKVRETSGLIYHDNGCWTFNDSGGEPELYKIDPKSGKIIQTVILGDAKNHDWEDLCQDDDYFYIGDFGNNHGNRKDLQVYRVLKSAIGDKPVETVSSGSIFFSYADQESYEDLNRKNNFDCESIISQGNELVLFTKNWENGRTRIYRLSKEPGVYRLSPEGDFDVAGLVTGADYNEADQTLVLIGYAQMFPFVYVVRDFDGFRLDTSSMVRIDFPSMINIQTEGICFTGDRIISVSAEETGAADQAIYRVNLDAVLPKDF